VQLDLPDPASRLYSLVQRHFEIVAQRGSKVTKQQQQQTPWPLFRKRTIPTERLPLIGKI
jgi:hypothetical protein